MYKKSILKKIWFSNFSYHIRAIYPPNILRKRLRKAYGLESISGVKQRLNIGVSVSDAWSFDNYLAQVIAQGVKFVRDDRCVGTPCRIYDENNKVIYEASIEYTKPASDLDNGKETDYTHDEGMEIWASILNQIIEGFEKYDTMIEAFEWIENKKDIRELSKEEVEELEKKFDIAFKLLHNNFSGLWT